MRTTEFSNSRKDISRYAQAADGLVHRNLVGNNAEEWSKCTWITKRVRNKKSSDRWTWLLDVVFSEDDTRFCSENAQKALNILRKFALLLHKTFRRGSQFIHHILFLKYYS
jgi:hypothetical protein